MGGELTVKSGQTLSQIAAQNNISLKALITANPGIKPDALSVGQKIVIPMNTKTESPVDKPDIKYSEKQKTSNETIQKAKEYGYGESYNFQTDKDGNYIVTIKDEKQLAKMKKELGIPSGVLAEYNNETVQNCKKPSVSVHSSENVYNDDNRYAGKGTKFFLPAGAMNPKDPEAGIGKALKNAWNAFCSSF